MLGANNRALAQLLAQIVFAELARVKTDGLADKTAPVAAVGRAINQPQCFG